MGRKRTETPEMREKRLEKARARQRERIAAECAEDKKRRLRAQREAGAKLRARKKRAMDEESRLIDDMLAAAFSEDDPVTGSGLQIEPTQDPEHVVPVGSEDIFSSITGLQGLAIEGLQEIDLAGYGSTVSTNLPTAASVADIMTHGLHGFQPAELMHNAQTWNLENVEDLCETSFLPISGWYQESERSEEVSLRSGSTKGIVNQSDDHRLPSEVAEESLTLATGSSSRLTPKKFKEAELEDDEVLSGGSGEERDQNVAAQVDPDTLYMNGQQSARQEMPKSFKGVTLNRGKWEAHVWDPKTDLETRNKSGSQIFLGQYKTAEDAAKVHDKAAIRFGLHERKNPAYSLNYPVDSYTAEDIQLEQQECNDRDYVWMSRRTSIGFTKGKSRMKGVIVKKRARLNPYEAKISSSRGGKTDFSLGVFQSEEEAGRQYDRAVLFLKGDNCIPNFRPSEYSVEEIAEVGRYLCAKSPKLRIHMGL